jgi:hypothetical protein
LPETIKPSPGSDLCAGWHALRRRTPGSLLTVTWTKVSGPGAVQFGDDSAAQTTALFNAPGTYVLRLTASDGSLSSSDDVQIVAGAGGNQPPGVSVGPDRTARPVFR